MYMLYAGCIAIVEDCFIYYEFCLRFVCFINLFIFECYRSVAIRMRMLCIPIFEHVCRLCGCRHGMMFLWKVSRNFNAKDLIFMFDLIIIKYVSIL
jgi:hypothetical protein